MDDQTTNDRSGEVELPRFGLYTEITKSNRPIAVVPIRDLPPRIQHAVEAVAKLADCHLNTAAWAVISSAAAAAQCVVRVETFDRTGKMSAASLFMHLIASSGERKSSAFSAAWKGIEECDSRIQERHAPRRARIHKKRRGQDSQPGDSASNDQGVKEEARFSTSIKQKLTEPTSEALIRDAQWGHPYPVIADPEGGCFYRGFSAGAETVRSMQTANTLNKMWSSEHVNSSRVGGGDGWAPNREIDADQYALGLATAAQNASIGADLLFSNNAETGMVPRLLVAESPAREYLMPNFYPQAEIDHAQQVMKEWRTTLVAMRKPVDDFVVASSRGPGGRGLFRMTENARAHIAKCMERIEKSVVRETVDEAVFSRVPEQACRIAAVLQAVCLGYPAGGQAHDLDLDCVKAATRLAAYYWDERKRIMNASYYDDVDETCASIGEVALRWLDRGHAGSWGKKGYNPDDNTFGWAQLRYSAKHTRQGGRHHRESSFHNQVKARLLDCNHFRVVGNRLEMNPDLVPAG